MIFSRSAIVALPCASRGVARLSFSPTILTRHLCAFLRYCRNFPGLPRARATSFRKAVFVLVCLICIDASSANQAQIKKLRRIGSFLSVDVQNASEPTEHSGVAQKSSNEPHWIATRLVATQAAKNPKLEGGARVFNQPALVKQVEKH